MTDAAGTAGAAGSGAARRFGSWRRAAAALIATAVTAVAAVGLAGLASDAAWARSHHRHADSADAPVATVPVSALPAEAVDTLHLIAAGGPFPYEKDGVVFGNFERILPAQRRGYYHEYTVPTPRAHNRGARRIVCGGPLRQTDDCYYSDDHYASFKRIVE